MPNYSSHTFHGKRGRLLRFSRTAISCYPHLLLIHSLLPRMTQSTHSHPVNCGSPNVTPLSRPVLYETGGQPYNGRPMSSNSQGIGSNLVTNVRVSHFKTLHFCGYRSRLSLTS
jgi:hypothetical protein